MFISGAGPGTLPLVYQGQSPRPCLWCHVHVMSCIKTGKLILYYSMGSGAGQGHPACSRGPGISDGCLAAPLPMTCGCCQTSKENVTKKHEASRNFRFAVLFERKNPPEGSVPSQRRRHVVFALITRIRCSHSKVDAGADSRAAMIQSTCRHSGPACHIRAVL